MLPGGTQGEFYSISSHIFAPPQERLRFSHLGRAPCCEGCPSLGVATAAGLLLPHAACTGAAKAAESAEDSTFGEETQTVLSPEFRNNFKMFREDLLRPIEQMQPSSLQSARF